MGEGQEREPNPELDRSRLFRELTESIDRQGRIKEEMARMLAGNPDQAPGKDEAFDQLGKQLSEEIKETGDLWVAWQKAKLH